MKSFKAGTILQLIYVFCCLSVVICMSLYAAFYTTQFGEICFRIGEFLILVSSFNPIGLIGTIMNFVACFTAKPKKPKKALIWVFASPILVALSYLVAVWFFVYHSGGV